MDNAIRIRPPIRCNRRIVAQNLVPEGKSSERRNMNAVVVVEKGGVGDKERRRGSLIIEELIGDFHSYRKKMG